MLAWFNRNGDGLQAIAGLLTVAVALLAIGGVWWQVGETGRQQREQSARDIYREFLALSVANPAFAQPDHCMLRESTRAAAYDDFVGYMLYMSEQVLEASPDWQPVIDDLFDRHAAAICSIDNTELYSPAIAGLIGDFRNLRCAGLSDCTSR